MAFTRKGKDHPCNGNKSTTKKDGSVEKRCSICKALTMTIPPPKKG